MTMEKSGENIDLTQLPDLSMDSESFAQDVAHYYAKTLGRRVLDDTSPAVLRAVVLATRDRLMERWVRSQRKLRGDNRRRGAYLSLEFLMGRLLRNSLINLDFEAHVKDALERLGLSLEHIYEAEYDAGLGNGGLGRLAACFLDSCATLGLPVTGYGIRYQYGMFHQQLENGYQIEKPDIWLREGYPWELERLEHRQTVKFGGRSTSRIDEQGVPRFGWTDTYDVIAIPYDIPVPGYDNDVVNHLRLWSASATDAFDLSKFNAGSYADAVARKNEAENITMVLYPNESTENGRELRLRQQYFLASASLQDMLRIWVEDNGADFTHFAEKHCFQLNDTHPAVAVAELMRLLMDEHGLSWKTAWQITTSTMAYTNHTLLPEALETWPVSMFSRLLPRLLDIIFEINSRFIEQVKEKWPNDPDRVRRMSLIGQGHEPSIRMAYLAIVGSYSVNGVAALHSKLLQEGLFKDFAELWPERFNNKTNGVTQRRWMAGCNPGLRSLITERIGPGWIKDLPQLEGLRAYREDPEFHKVWQQVREENKSSLANDIRAKTGISLSVDMLYDVQVKRIHEYKRQLLNVLHVVHLYDRIRRGDGEDIVPRVVIIGGKAAPGYVMAKSIIKCINNVASVINNDPIVRGKLKLIFYPDYNVSAMEKICTAADLSEQISTAGKEASGTGNMKFMMNGAVTIGTLDGANVEIREAVGEENFFLFGMTVEEIEEHRSTYYPRAIIQQDEDLSRVFQLFESNHFSENEPGVLNSVIDAIRVPSDPWMTVADFRGFVDAQKQVEQVWLDQPRWLKMSISNTAASGRFSTDRTMQEYNSDIWRLDALM